MRVIMQIRRNAFELQGGDTVQMLKTKEALEHIGIEVDVSTDLRPDVSKYDVVHLFNLTRVQETYIQAKNAKSQGKPIVLSTIYWPINEFEKNAAVGIRGFIGKHVGVDTMERLKALGKYLLNEDRGEGAQYLIGHSYTDMQREILKLAEVCLPNAMTEMVKIRDELGFETDSVIVVPNAVDTQSIVIAHSDNSDNYSKYKDWIVCVGRIDVRKNQMTLLDALENSDYNLLIVGKKSPGHMGYANRVVERVNASSNMEYIEHIPNEEIYKLYKQCKVSILPSWFETPGLASLEAAAMGCAIVVSPKGTTQDYFGDLAYYCDVQDPSSIRQCIEKAYGNEYDDRLSKKILSEYTWENAAAKTLQGYERAIRAAK